VGRRSTWPSVSVNPSFGGRFQLPESAAPSQYFFRNAAVVSSMLRRIVRFACAQ
jgi:hypothetical protein